MFGELKHDIANMKNEIRQEWKQDLRQEFSTIRQDVSNLRKDSHTSLRNLETQVAQNSKALAERPHGALPSTTVNNPGERVQAVTLRSGKEFPEPTLKKSTNSKSPIEEDNDGLESFTFSDDSLSNEHVNNLHVMLGGDDDMSVDASLCDLNDVEIVNFYDNCLDDAIYIHELLGEVEEETDENMPPKSRRKECAKKRKHDVEASSGAVQGESDVLIAGGRSLRHLSGAQIVRVEELQAKGVSGGFYFDYTMLDAYRCRAEVERMMSRWSWEHLFSWRDDTYEPVVHEFIATFTPMPSNHMCTLCMKFALFGREYEISLIQLGEYLGFYTSADIDTEEWRNLPLDFDSDAAAEAYWHRITNGEGGRFTGTKPNTSKIVSPTLKIMKLLLNLTFGGRHKNLHKVYRTDLFYLWSLETNEPIQMACMVQQLFTSQTHPKYPYVWIGPVVTRLCHGLGLQRELTREKSIASMRPFSDAQLNRSYAPKIGAAPRPPQGEPQQGQESVIEGGPDVPPEYAEYPPVYDCASMRAFQL
nr:uncharacterized protein LOC109154451 [Ipomoea batatas]